MQQVLQHQPGVAHKLLLALASTNTEPAQMSNDMFTDELGLGIDIQ